MALLLVLQDDELDAHIRGRNCDRAVEGSAALEGLHEISRVRLRQPAELESHA